jgi:integrase
MMVGRRKVASRLPPRLYEYRGKRRTSYYTITRDNRWVGLGRDLIAAKKKLAELDGDIAAVGTIAELIDDFLKELERLVDAGKRAPRTLADRKVEAENLKTAFGKMRPDAVTPAHIWKYLHKFRGVEAPIRANREISFFQGVFNWARGQGIVRDNPCVGVERNEEAPRERLVTNEELASYLRLAREDGDVSTRAALAVWIAYLTGKAQGQILRLTRNQLTDEGIEFGKRKGGARVLVEWSDKLRVAVDESLAMPAAVATMFVVHTQEGGPYTSDGFKKGWQLLMGKWVAGGLWADGTQRLPGERFTFHDLRGKAITTLKEQGRNASELTGHRSEAVIAKVYDRRRIRKAAAVE